MRAVGGIAETVEHRLYAGGGYPINDAAKRRPTALVGRTVQRALHIDQAGVRRLAVTAATSGAESVKHSLNAGSTDTVNRSTAARPPPAEVVPYNMPFTSSKSPIGFPPSPAVAKLCSTFSEPLVLMQQYVT